MEIRTGVEAERGLIAAVLEGDLKEIDEVGWTYLGTDGTAVGPLCSDSRYKKCLSSGKCCIRFVQVPGGSPVTPQCCRRYHRRVWTQIVKLEDRIPEEGDRL